MGNRLLPPLSIKDRYTCMNRYVSNVIKSYDLDINLIFNYYCFGSTHGNYDEIRNNCRKTTVIYKFRVNTIERIQNNNMPYGVCK